MIGARHCGQRGGSPAAEYAEDEDESESETETALAKHAPQKTWPHPATACAAATSSRQMPQVASSRARAEAREGEGEEQQRQQEQRGRFLALLLLPSPLPPSSLLLQPPWLPAPLPRPRSLPSADEWRLLFLGGRGGGASSRRWRRGGWRRGYGPYFLSFFLSRVGGRIEREMKFQLTSFCFAPFSFAEN